MRSGVAFSAVMHVALAILIVFGLPLAKKKLAPLAPPVAIEIINIAEKTNPPKGKKRAAKAKKPTPKPPRTRQAAAPRKPEPKPKPPVKRAEKPPPKPKPIPKPVVKKAEKPKPAPKKPPQVAALPKPKAEKKPPPKPEPKPKAAQPAPQPRVKAKPAPKPKARPRPRKRMSLAQLLESANKLKPRAKTGKREAPTARRGSPRHDASRKLSSSELDALKRQIVQCWYFPAGARDAKDLVVEISVVVNRDRTVRQARIVDVARMRRDPFYRSAAESARRAMLNPRCSPLKLPPEKYDLWRSMTLTFNPKEAFGR
ncbi:MAG: hypothetical protein ACTSUD_06590 [Alphaproteobacteria bacterium]